MPDGEIIKHKYLNEIDVNSGKNRLLTCLK